MTNETMTKMTNKPAPASWAIINVANGEAVAEIFGAKPHCRPGFRAVPIGDYLAGLNTATNGEG